ncbi:hypothetical protein EBU95_20905 [bacterium]|nr:hypothetical protein [bacterium]
MKFEELFESVLLKEQQPQQTQQPAAPTDWQSKIKADVKPKPSLLKKVAKGVGKAIAAPIQISNLASQAAGKIDDFNRNYGKYQQTPQQPKLTPDEQMKAAMGTGATQATAPSPFYWGRITDVGKLNQFKQSNQLFVWNPTLGLIDNQQQPILVQDVQPEQQRGLYTVTVNGKQPVQHVNFDSFYFDQTKRSTNS